MVVCEKCAQLGSMSWELQSSKRVNILLKPSSPKALQKRQPPSLPEELELVVDFSLRVRRGREEMGLSQEDLGKKIGEKVSVLRKIESGKMAPDYKLAGKLEHILRIKLLAPLSKRKTPSKRLSTPREVTLGDVVRSRARKRR